MSGSRAGVGGSPSERSIADLLRALGWSEIIAAEPSSEVPEDGRDNYRDELLVDRFREKICVINPELDEQQLNRVYEQVRHVTSEPDLVEANKSFTELLLQGIVVPGVPGQNGGRSRRVRLVDWGEPASNDLRVIRNFRLDRPLAEGSPSVVLDYVLFVNGLPLAVIRDPAPDRTPTVSEAIADLRSYTGERQDGPLETIPGLFSYTQVLVATDGSTRALLGTITSAPEHFAEWKSVEPTRQEQIRAEFGLSPNRLTSLERLVIGALRPAHLLDLIRNFTAFQQTDDRVMKLVARYPQFRAVHRITNRLLTGEPGAPGRKDRRGGVVWHTQGSGKSYTMAFLIRKMRTTPGLSDFKVVVAVDRVDLRKQLNDSLALSGETVRPAGGVLHARELLSDGVPDVVLIMMQHAQRDDSLPDAENEPERLGTGVLDSRVHFPELTRSMKVVVIADEAHRTQGGWLHSRLQRGLPGAAWIGFTGTPLTKEDKLRRRTTGVFGKFFDTYTLRESVADGATVPIRYEQRRSEAFLVDRVALDAEYAEEVGGTPEDRETEQRKLNTRQILESEDLIAAKARDMLRHWVSIVLPNGFKAQVATALRLAAVRYHDALHRARDDLVAELVAYRAVKEQDPDYDHPDRRFLEAALPFEPLLRIVDFVPVISPGDRRDPRTGEIRRDPPDWARWTSGSAHDTHIALFKARLPAPETIGSGGPSTAEVPGPGPWTSIEVRPELASRGAGPWDYVETADDDLNYRPAASPSSPSQGPGGGATPVAFIIVQSMLLTGFDAPVEQVLYLDRPIKDVELLQAIARVNRTARLKTVGLVVAYVGLLRHLDVALSSYDDEDIIGAKTFLDEEDVPRLHEARDAVRNFLSAHGIGPLTGTAETDKLLVLLSDTRLRSEFDRLVNEFVTYLDRVLPRDDALRYEDDAREFGAAQYRVRNCFRDTRSGGLDPYTYGAKVRHLIDDHLTAIGIAQRVPPIEITAADFRERVLALDNPHVRAMEMEHALRRHLAERLGSDPAYYEQLSDRLDRLLDQLRDDAERLATALDELIHEVREREAAVADGDLDPRTERPIRSILERAYAENTAEIRARALTAPGEAFEDLSRRIAIVITREVSPPHFMTSRPLQEDLRRRIYGILRDSDLYGREAAGRAARELLALARAVRDHFLRRGEPDE